MANSVKKPFSMKYEEFREKVSSLLERSKQFKNICDVGLKSYLKTCDDDNPLYLYLDGLLMKLSLTFCLKSENSSMRSIARYVLFQFMDYETSTHKLEDKLNQMDPVAVWNNLKNNSDTFDSKISLIKGLIQLFKISILVIKWY